MHFAVVFAASSFFSTQANSTAAPWVIEFLIKTQNNNNIIRMREREAVITVEKCFNDLIFKFFEQQQQLSIIVSDGPSFCRVATFAEILLCVGVFPLFLFAHHCFVAAGWWGE